MLEMLDEKMLCVQFCAQIKLHRRSNGMVLLETPFAYPDGDQYPIYLTETGAGGLHVSDGGHTLMHLSYENDVDKFFEGSRSILLDEQNCNSLFANFNNGFENHVDQNRR